MNVVFIFNEFSLHNHIIESYRRSRPGDKISLVKVPLVLRGKSRTETAARILPNLSKRFIWGKFKEAVVVLMITTLPKLLGRGAVFRRLSSIAKKFGFPFHVSYDVNSEKTKEFISAQNPDVIVSLFHQIVREPLIKIPRLGFLNIHPGILPEFRGIQPYFWELMTGFGRGGATIHFIKDESLDTGPIVAQASFPTHSEMSVQLNYYLTCLCAGQILPEVLSRLDSGDLKPIPQDTSAGNYYRWPDSAAVSELLRRGHSVISICDLRDILCGKYDAFQADKIVVYK